MHKLWQNRWRCSCRRWLIYRNRVTPFSACLFRLYNIVIVLRMVPFKSPFRAMTERRQFGGSPLGVRMKTRSWFAMCELFCCCPKPRVRLSTFLLCLPSPTAVDAAFAVGHRSWYLDCILTRFGKLPLTLFQNFQIKSLSPSLSGTLSPPRSLSFPFSLSLLFSFNFLLVFFPIIFFFYFHLRYSKALADL